MSTPNKTRTLTQLDITLETSAVRLPGLKWTNTEAVAVDQDLSILHCGMEVLTAVLNERLRLVRLTPEKYSIV